MRSSRATLNLFSLSAGNAETAINTPQVLDTSLVVSMDNIVKLDPRRETDAEEANGREEAGKVYDRGNTSSTSLSFDKMMAQHAAIFLAFGLGNIVSTAQGSGYLHTITPRENPFDYDRDQLAMTVAQKLGTVVKRRFSSLFVDSVELSYSRDQFAKLSTSLKGTGKFESSVKEQIVSLASNATALPLVADGVHGATDEERLDSIHQVYAELTPGVRTEVVVTAVSDATPAELTIEAPGAEVTAIPFTILYAPNEAAWASLPATITESPMEVCGLRVFVGGKWDGAAFVGGREISSEITELTYSLQNNISVAFAPGGCSSHANKCTRSAREQVVKLGREMRDYILQRYLEKNETFGIELDLIGDEFATGEQFQMKTVIPVLAVLDAPISVKDKKLAEAGDLLVLDGGEYPSVIHTIRNQVAGYAL